VAAGEVTPVTVLTGFLGSGKSTLLNRMVREPRFADTAIVVNEWGEMPIDHALVRESNENIVLLAGGCICCRVAGDLVGRLRELHFQRASGLVPRFRRVVIETTGLADPAPLLATLIEMPVVAARYALAGVIATVDAEHGARALDAHPEAVKQVAMADRLVLTKVDRVPAAGVAALEARLRALNPAAPILRSRNGDADPARLFDAGLYRLDAPPDAAGWLNAGAYRSFAAPGNHDARIASFAWTLDAPVDAEDFGAALETLVELQGERILRMKGLVQVAGREGPMAVHAVQHTLYPPAWLDRWPDADRRTRLVFIGLALEEASVAQILNSFLVPKNRHGLPQQHP
jgi:G3E family GTPase